MTPKTTPKTMTPKTTRLLPPLLPLLLAALAACSGSTDAVPQPPPTTLNFSGSYTGEAWAATPNTGVTYRMEGIKLHQEHSGGVEGRLDNVHVFVPLPRSAPNPNALNHSLGPARVFGTADGDEVILFVGFDSPPLAIGMNLILVSVPDTRDLVGTYQHGHSDGTAAWTFDG